ncbi:HK97 gp10 family phage protein [Cryobacterium sp. MDB1-18-2]|uniref:HK97 gp10 family phage protein n=1 Tax=unclassified Cryobacterium TaxID=2649013 RepID=UPI0010696CC0|nr:MULTISPECIES: HK97 gp10 family phage protein [unclassified Cryobacterium]TFC30110.1 HK97 gp10 family phage protein [Cryobacterium sp. MDB1-18-2]TFC41390.1 HK97 gp10 family phage protein [Cryobacterium sp. MDB1-18-1]
MKFNESYFDELGNSAPVVALVVQAATDVADAAIASAPVDTGAYRDGIHVEVRRAAHRVVAVIVASAADSMIVEATTGNLARALRSAGRSG